MSKRSFLLSFTTVILLLFATQSFSFELFVWRHDNRLRVNDTVLNSSITATDAVVRTLDNLDFDYDTGTNLPDDLNRYDVVLTCLSFYCPG